MNVHPSVSYRDLCGPEPPDWELPWLDRRDLPPVTLKRHQIDWRYDGVVKLEGFLPDELIDAYCELRQRLEDRGQRGGWRTPCPYLQYDQIKHISLYRPLMVILRDLIGHPMGLHLNLTGWVSTERNWHQDDYLNPSHVNAHYAAVWMALADIHPDSGPFEYVRGSHHWPLIRRDRLFEHLTPAERSSPDWPSVTQTGVAAAMECEMHARAGKVIQWIPKRGDVLIWHGRLMHRGSQPIVPGMQRKALICHYSSIKHRPDMPQAILLDMERHDPPIKGHYFPLDVPMDEGERV